MIFIYCSSVTASLTTCTTHSQRVVTIVTWSTLPFYMEPVSGSAFPEPSAAVRSADAACVQLTLGKERVGVYVHAR